MSKSTGCGPPPTWFILLISHDLDYVRRSADRVLLLDTSVKAAGTPAEVFASPAFRDAFPGHK